MIRNFLVVAAAVCAIAGSALAEPLSTIPDPAGFSAAGTVRAASPLVSKAYYYACQRDCTWCRNDCYNAYRVNCYGPHCRRSFVLCMRGCWYNICRSC